MYLKDIATITFLDRAVVVICKAVRAVGGVERVTGPS